MNEEKGAWWLILRQNLVTGKGIVLCYNKEIWLCWLWRGFVANIEWEEKFGTKEEWGNLGIINKSK